MSVTKRSYRSDVVCLLPLHPSLVLLLELYASNGAKSDREDEEERPDAGDN